MNWKGSGRKDRDNVIGTANLHGLDAPVFQIMWGQGIFFVSITVETGPRAHLAVRGFHTVAVFRVLSGRDVMLATNFHVAPKLRMDRATHLLALSAFMVWSREIFAFLYILRDVRGGNHGLVEVLFRYLPGESEEIREKPGDCRCSAEIQTGYLLPTSLSVTPTSVCYVIRCSRLPVVETHYQYRIGSRGIQFTKLHVWVLLVRMLKMAGRYNHGLR